MSCKGTGRKYPPHGLGQKAVHQKGVGGADHFAPRGHQGPHQQVQDFVGAVAQDELLGWRPK